MLQAGDSKPSDSTDYILCKAPLTGDAPEILHPLEDVTVNAPETILLECDVDFGKPESKVEW